MACTTKTLLIVLMLGLCTTVVAQTKPSSPWDGTKASAGLSITTGNSENSNFNGQFDLNYAFGYWKNVAVLLGQYGKSNGVINQQQYSIQDQIQYSFNNNPKVDNYVYTQGNYQSNQFGAYLTQLMFTVGYGRDWIKTPKFQFTTQLGPSFRRTTEQPPGREIENSINASTTVILVWNINPNLAFSENIAYTYGLPANYLKSTTALTSKIICNLAFSLSFTVENWSTVPKGSSNKVTTNTSTAANLVYSF